jgi:hypothetical protein
MLFRISRIKDGNNQEMMQAAGVHDTGRLK